MDNIVCIYKSLKFENIYKYIKVWIYKSLKPYQEIRKKLWESTSTTENAKPFIVVMKTAHKKTICN